MESNEISMMIDVKLDINERKVDFYELRSWTRCCVKIEAIKCFPCYVKISFSRSIGEDNKTVAVKINIPGLSVELAESRTKQHSYALLWKNNRKDCSIFFAFDSQMCCDRHMKWIKKSIKNLELHRREILETRRNSRNSFKDDAASVTLSFDSSKFNNTQAIRDINDILGPLPALPDSSINWSRRISGFSGIYEEILDGDNSNKNIGRKSSRASVTSGIYEIMKPQLNSIDETSLSGTSPSPPPPLPPRQRCSTQGEYHRSNTNPETDAFKKRSNLFDGDIELNSKYTFCDDSFLAESKFTVFYDADKPPSNFSTTTDLYKFSHYENHSSELCSANELPQTNHSTNDDLKMISNKTPIISSPTTTATPPTSTIEPLSALESTDTLSNNVTKNVRRSCLIDEGTGYCRMVPVFNTQPTDSAEILKDLPIIGVTEKSCDKNVSTLFSHLNSTFITFRRDFEMNRLSDGIERLETDTKSPTKTDTTNETNEQNISTDNQTQKTTEQPHCISNETVISTNQIVYKSPYTGIVVNEKYPSYFPNPISSTSAEKNITTKKRKKHVFSKSKSSLAEFVSPLTVKPTKGAKKSPKSAEVIPKTATPNGNCTEFDFERPTTPSATITQTLSDLSPHLNSQITPIYHQQTKYATLARLTPTNSYTEKNSATKKSSDLGASIKRFASLPRFRKIDFSPLKLKINSVLHRQNHDF